MISVVSRQMHYLELTSRLTQRSRMHWVHIQTGSEDIVLSAVLACPAY